MIQKFQAGKYIQQYQYRSFSPNRVNHSFDWEDKTIDLLLAEAMRALGELDAYSQLIPNIDFFIKMHVLKEATISNRIEGTKTDIDEAILPESEILPERRDDWQEVQNYIKAMNYAIGRLGELPLSMRLLKETHKVLLSGVRGKNKSPGEVRMSQNWVGGSSPSDALYVPPHHDELSDLLNDLESFWHNKRLHIPVLIKVAVTHYQFETLHPFLDGNGRLGRLLIVLQLVEAGILSKPSLYISDFFNENRTAYYEAFNVVRDLNDIEHWIKFFLNAVISTAMKGKETFRKIMVLRESYESRVIKLGRRVGLARKLIEFMYNSPVMSVNNAAKVLGVTYGTANRCVKELSRLRVLTEITDFSRNRLYVLDEYVGLFRT